MFFINKKRRKSRGASPLNDSAVDGPAERGSRPWLAWRRSAQKVTRMWKAWLAAEGAERERLYRCYVYALAEEERAAAELQRLINPHASALPDPDPVAARPPTVRPRDR